MKKPKTGAKQLKMVLWILFLAAVYLILYKTIFNIPFDDSHPIRLELFWELNQWIRGNGYGKDIIKNILLFIPFGITLGMIWNSWRVVLAGFGFSLLVELSQLVFRIGWFELDDILNNTIGTALGFAVAVLIRKAIKNHESQNGYLSSEKSVA